MTDEADLTGPSRPAKAGRERRIVAEFDSFAELLDRCVGRLSEEAVFLPTSVRAATGSHVAFELRVRDGFSVLRGEGEVAEPAAGVEGDGVAVRFDYLDQPSLRLLPRLIEHYRRRGLPTFEVAAPLPQSEVEATESRAAEEEPERPSAADTAVPELTLDDLEAEFLARKPAADPTSERAEPAEPRRPGGAALLVDAVELSAETPVTPDRIDRPAPPSGSASGSEAARLDDAEPRLEEVGSGVGESLPGLDEAGTGADEPPSAPATEALTAEEIQLDELFSDEPSPGDADDAAAEAGDQRALDPGLPWLTDQPSPRQPRLWVVLLLILLGALLGAAFYFFFLRGGSPAARVPPREAPEPVGVAPLPQPPEAGAGPVAAPVAGPVNRPRLAAFVGPSGAASEEEVPPAPAAAPADDRPSAPAPGFAEAPPGSTAAAGESLTGIDRITWTEQGDETVVVLWADGSIRVEQIEDFRVVDGAPREVVKIRGVRRPCLEQQVEVASDHVRRIRTGLHETEAGGELHVVADLVDGEVELRRTVADGSQLRMYFAKSG